MIRIGREYELDVIKETDFGYFLDAEDLGEILLPRKLAPADLAVGDYVVVFLYLDSEDRPVATTQKPKARAGEFAYLQVKDTTQVGAFLDWGLNKDLLVPFAEQHRPMEVGKSYLVYIYINEQDGRIVASSKVDKFIDEERPHTFKPKQPVDLIIANSTDLGFKAIVNNKHWGVLYKDDVQQRLSFGQSIKGYIKNVRPDGKIDLMLHSGKEKLDKNAGIIKDYLEKHGGYSNLHDKSDPKEIYRTFGLSKAAFKKAIGNLYKQRIITLEKDGIRLTDSTK